MGTLTANLHLMMNTFYRPTPGRYKLLCEGRAFPSDQVLLPSPYASVPYPTFPIVLKYAFASQVQLHGFKPEDAIIEMNPRQGEFTLREEDILEVIEKHGSSIALVIFSGVQYYTGQWFPMQSITKAAKAQVRFYTFMPGSSSALGECPQTCNVRPVYFSQSQHLLRFYVPARLIGAIYRVVFVGGTWLMRSETSPSLFTIGTSTGQYGAATSI